jgi:putative radical SAM enzyme (TIGR03279 family)
MSAPVVTSVAEASPAARAGLEVGDELVSLDGRVPSDVIEFQQLTDGETVEVLVRRSGPEPPRVHRVHKQAGEPLGIEVSSAVFDRVRTCDNHCAFCFIYQLPKGMRRSLYLKDDDYRLSFLYGNFTTLTRFTELDAERVLEQRLGPLFVSIHATDPAVRARMLRNPRGATSLRWLQVLLDGGIEVHGQVVVCPGVNDGEVLEDTLAGILDEYPRLATVGVVPLGLSRYSNEPDMRPHSAVEAVAVCDAVAEWQEIYRSVLGRRLVHAADEYYLLAGRAFPPAADYDGYPQHENGIGMARAFAASFAGEGESAGGVRHGFFAAVDGAPAEGYRAPRLAGATSPVRIGRGRRPRPVAIVTGSYGARVLGPLLEAHGHREVRIVTVQNEFFGGNIGVAGLMTGSDVARALSSEPDGHRYLLPDACLSQGRFLDGLTVGDLPRAVEALPTEGRALRAALGAPAPVACAPVGHRATGPTPVTTAGS